ncbi:MAG: DNA replication and repair protein RecF, partial [Spirochaetia bacterium]|nr:DNA replication and repair protein RecF [Spirochaetia bacterium]
MKLLSLHLVHFRNYPSLDLSFSAPRNLIQGSNGQGKTNLLEAIYYCSRFTSFRTRDGRDLLENERPFFHIQAEYESGDLLHDLNIHFAEGEKTVRLDHKALPSQRRHFRDFPVFFFSHQDLDLALGPPVGRREYFDSALELVSEPYGETLRAYARALAQRNAELRSGSHSGVWDEALAHHGLRIIKARLSFLTAIGSHFEKIYQRFFDGKGLEGTIGYLHRQKFSPTLEGLTPPDAETYLQNLLTYLPADLKTRTTHYGPHKDDFGFYFGGHPLKSQASQG